MADARVSGLVGPRRPVPSSRVRVVAVWWLACLLWSSTFLFIKIGLADIPPFTFAWTRLALALVVLVPIAGRRAAWRALGRADIARMAACGTLLLGVNYALVYWGAQFVPSGLVAILLSATPVVALAFGWLIGSERVTLRKLLALAGGVAGVTIIFGGEARASGAQAIAGSVAVFGAAACVAVAYGWLKSSAIRVEPIVVTTIQCAAGLLPLASVALIVEGPPAPAQWSPAAWAALMYLALCGSVLAFWLNYWLLARMDASVMLLMGVAEVPIAVGLGAVILGERLPPSALAGGACVLAGIVTGLAGSDERRGESSQVSTPVVPSRGDHA